MGVNEMYDFMNFEAEFERWFTGQTPPPPVLSDYLRYTDWRVAQPPIPLIRHAEIIGKPRYKVGDEVQVVRYLNEDNTYPIGTRLIISKLFIDRTEPLDSEERIIYFHDNRHDGVYECEIVKWGENS